MTMLFDANKRLIKVNDIYPEDVQLAKGSYTIRAQLRHDNRGAHKTLNVLGACTWLLMQSCNLMVRCARRAVQPPALQRPVTWSSKAAR